MAASGAVSDAGIECHSTVSRLRVYNRVGAGRPIRVVWALEEVGADYELVTITAEEGRSASYRARHPLGRVPVLEDEQGPMFESTALVFHVAEQYPEVGLLPPPATHERTVVQGWSIFAMTELEAPAIESARQREANAEAWSRSPRGRPGSGRRRSWAHAGLSELSETERLAAAPVLCDQSRGISSD